jgi:hypothetical protein
MLLIKCCLIATILVLNACGVVPKREFSEYNYVFQQVREVGEKVIIDYALAKKEQAQLKKNQTIQLPRKNTFTSQQLTISQLPVEDVAMRLRAWNVMASYNGALTQLIAGKSLKVTHETLLSKLFYFSMNSIRETAIQLSPIAATLNAIIVEVEKGMKRHNIIKSIKRISTIISSQLIVSMKKDSELFYNIRYSINQYYYQKLRVNISRHIRIFRQLANEIEPNEQEKKVLPLVKVLNKRLNQIAMSALGRKFSPIILDKPKPLKKISRRSRRKKIYRRKYLIGKALLKKIKAEKSRVVLLQLSVLKTQILMLLDKAEQQNVALEAYHAMLTAYVRLLNQMDLSLRVMQQAAVSGHSVTMSMEKDFEIALIKMNQAFLYYQKTY